jgi:hypothetical protein
MDIPKFFINLCLIRDTLFSQSFLVLNLQKLNETYSFPFSNYFTNKYIWFMKFLLTSACINNKSIHDALVDMLGKPVAEASALCIPTGVYAIPGGAGHAWRFFSGT